MQHTGLSAPDQELGEPAGHDAFCQLPPLALQDQVNGGRCDGTGCVFVSIAVRHGVSFSNKLSAAWIAVVCVSGEYPVRVSIQPAWPERSGSFRR